MNYEDLYEHLQGAEKQLKDAMSASQRLQKTIVKDTESGDLKDLKKCLDALKDSTLAQREAEEKLRELAESFDAETYFKDGDFTSQMLDACRDGGVDVIGEFPLFEMFPYSVRIDAENQDLYLNRKKVSCMRPSAFVKTVKDSREKLMKAKFNAKSFLGEMEDAYDLAVLKTGKRTGCDMYLLDLYKYMVPMARSRKEYDRQAYAFDLARLYQVKDDVETKDGRRFRFGSSRKINKCIRILDQNGEERFLATIQFV